MQENNTGDYYGRTCLTVRSYLIYTLIFHLIQIPTMQSVVVVLSALVSVAIAQVWLLPGEDKYKFDSPWAHFKQRGITWDKQVGGGKVFGTVGSNDQGLFGKGGYQRTIFNDARGKMDAQAYGTRVLSPNGDSTNFGGKLNWANDNAKASVDVNKQIHGSTTIEATGAGKWHPGKNTEVSAGGTVTQTGGGKPDVTINAQVEHKF